MPPIDRIPDATIVYRTLTKAVQISRDGRPQLHAFFRERKDETGMSVDYDVPSATPQHCGTHLSGHRAILALETGAIRATEYRLNVVPDTENHAEINTSVPYWDDPENEERAKQIAAALILIAGDPVWRKPTS